MKKYTSIFVILFIFMNSNGFSQSISLGLVGDYPFSGGALDLSGCNNNCIVHGPTLTTGRNGQLIQHIILMA